MPIFSKKNEETKKPEDQTFQDAGEESFKIDAVPRLIQLPPYEKKQEINVRYPLIPPYAFAHIYWDKKSNELLYEIEEPILDEVEKELLQLIQIGLEEMINISYVRAEKSNMLMQYLEKNVKSILVELGTTVSKKTYQKLLYYIYRDAIGLNEIEPMMKDYYIEDVECNGLNFPLYIVHRKYQNLRTNLIFKNASKLSDFIEKLAQKAGRYVSYAKPLLDGTLPDGSRVNATYTEDVTTRGPTFTIRKFTKEPWTPVQLIQFKTSTAEMFAYLWMAVEYKFNIMSIGETASGKTTFLNAVLSFIPPEARICSIEDTREINLEHDNWLPAVTRAGFGIKAGGEEYGGITLFDLLRESFRQNPDYVVVGETRGAEASVLFQGMASGHASYTTFHAGSAEGLVKRLETPPINLSPSLVEALDIVVICNHIKTEKKNFRRLTEIDEIMEVEPGLAKIKKNVAFIWDSQRDIFKMNTKSEIIRKLSERAGISQEEVIKEMQTRTKVLNAMVQKDITEFEDFNRIINQYYKNPESIIKELGIK